ncbi:hypothetical protein BGZ91_002137, partial [Linnemannia elongata]
MRIGIPSTVILTLAVASSVYAAPAAPTHHLEKRGWLMDKMKDAFAKAVKSLECGACVTALVVAKDVSYLNKNWVLDAAAGMCTDFKVMPKDVCHGLVYSQGPVLVNSIRQASLLSGDGKHICHQVLGACAPQGVQSGIVSFPKPKPAFAVAPTHSGNTIDILHLSDWHVDDKYEPGAEADCNRPLCCRKYDDSPLTPKRKASSWGDYKCDSPVKLGVDLLKFVPKVANVSFSILTGDVPPHDIWLQNRESVIKEEDAAYKTMADGLPTKVYPTVGNHEAGPTNLFPTKASGGDIQWLYDSLADDWSRWLPADAVKAVKSYGAYTTYVADMNQAATWDATGSSPNWHLEYSARKSYGAYAPIAADQPLSAGWWHNVTSAFETNPAAFQDYW